MIKMVFWLACINCSSSSQFSLDINYMLLFIWQYGAFVVNHTIRLPSLSVFVSWNIKLTHSLIILESIRRRCAMDQGWEKPKFLGLNVRRLDIKLW